MTELSSSKWYFCITFSRILGVHYGFCNHLYVIWGLGELCLLLGFCSSGLLLAILGLLWFHINFWIVCYSSVKNVMSNFIGVALNLYIALGSMAIFMILILPTQGHGIAFHFFEVFLISWINVFIVLSI